MLHPEFHGREHFNLRVFDEKIHTKDLELLTALKNRSLTSISFTGYENISFTAAFNFEEVKENESFQPIIREGLNAFRQIFGFSATHFNPPGGSEHPLIHKYLYENGIRYLDAPLLKKEHRGQGKFKRKFHYTGKRNRLNQIFMVRNCVFEPTHDQGIDWVNHTFRQVELAFQWNRPAIISSHRVNFCGQIDPANRKKGLDALKRLLNKIVEKYPDVEFMTAPQLGQKIEQDGKA